MEYQVEVSEILKPENLKSLKKTVTKLNENEGKLNNKFLLFKTNLLFMKR